MDKLIIRVQNISKTYNLKTYNLSDNVQVEALKDVSLDIRNGEFVAIMGPSGSGKSTLLNIIGCLDRPTKGEYLFDGLKVDKMTDDELATIRNKRIGFVFQTFNLLPRFNAIKNVELPLLYSKVNRGKREEIALEMLKRVGLANRKHHTPFQLSGGETQRVAIARALVNNPKILLADEPTGNLDTKTSNEIMGIFQGLNEEGITILLITHNETIANFAHRKISIIDGKIVDDYLT